MPQDVKEVEVPEKLMLYCVNSASKHFKISPMIVYTIADIEGGKIGTASKNKNGTYDLGVMQLNTINIDRIKEKFPNVTYMDLIYKPCVNIYVGTWFLTEEIKRVNYNVLKGIGNYHSRTKKFHDKYMKRFTERYKKNLKKFVIKKKLDK